MLHRTILSSLLGLTLAGTLPAQTAPAPGHDHSGGAAGTGFCAMQPPLRGIHAYLCGFHFYAGDQARQLVAHHYCSRYSPDVMQCVIYDSNRSDARLVGIEYIVTARVFQALPEAEKRLWHSHRYEVKSGQLIAPALGPAEEKAMMRDLVTTYGKTWQTWQTDRHSQVPMGIPQLLMGFTADGQALPGMVAGRDRQMGVSTADRKAKRTDLPAPAPDPGADAWQKGEAVQLDLRPVPAPAPSPATRPEPSTPPSAIPPPPS